MKKTMAIFVVAMLATAGLSALNNDFVVLDISPPGAYEYYITGISGNNIVGYYCTDDNYIYHGFLYNGTNYITIDPPDPWLGWTELYGIDGSKIVGTYYTVFWESHAFIYDYDSDVWTPLEKPGAYAIYPRAVRGDKIAGDWFDTSYPYPDCSFVYDGANWTTIDAAGNLYIYGVYGSNVVGRFYSAGDQCYGILFDGVNRHLFSVPGTTQNYTIMYGIWGDIIVGTYHSAGKWHGFICNRKAILANPGSPANWVTIDPPGSIYTVLKNICGNTVLGIYCDASECHYFLYTIPGPQLNLEVSSNAQNIELSFSDLLPGNTYSINFSTNLVNWTNVETLIVETNGNVTYSAPISGSKGFYKATLQTD